MKRILIDFMGTIAVGIVCGYLITMTVGVPFTLLFATTNPNTECEIKSRWFYIGFPMHYACVVGKYMSQPRE